MVVWRLVPVSVKVYPCVYIVYDFLLIFVHILVSSLTPACAFSYACDSIFGNGARDVGIPALGLLALYTRKL